MRIRVQILAVAFLAGTASAQTTPASQTPPASQTVKDTTAQTAPPAKAKVSETKAKAPHAATKTSHMSVKASQSVQKSPFAPKVAKTQAVSKATGSKETASVKQTAPAPVKKQSAPAEAKAAQKPPVPVPTEAAKKPASPAETAAPAPPAPAETATPLAQAPVKLPSPGKRDPFQNPISAAALRGPANCASGKHCLLIDQIALKGIVQMKSGNIALVENAARRPYFLKENDALFNGSVVKITGDTVVFKEDSSDILGRPVSKEVIKKVSAPAV
jgi:hypothetical protein